MKLKRFFSLPSGEKSSSGAQAGKAPFFFLSLNSFFPAGGVSHLQTTCGLPVEIENQTGRGAEKRHRKQTSAAPHTRLDP